ncbi:uncharacterized protein LOC103317730 [Nasonia vitripennis]|uniref:Uncharacterized protein n=1 Tax=Nasonia vitripennis TaxID=7425 RepID=A0A7M7QCJ0_NASVI|nr:uncharacterized protein LOC103317730 [Nasonia vitripennis]
MKSMKTSLQHDYRERTDNILSNLAASGISLTSDGSLITLRGLLTKTTLAEFQELYESIKEGSEQLKILPVWMVKYINCAECYKTAISKVLNSIMAKSVQMEYSGCGRAIKGVKKLNFSATSIFKLMKTLNVEKFTVSEETILLRTSRWLPSSMGRSDNSSVFNL